MDNDRRPVQREAAVMSRMTLTAILAAATLAAAIEVPVARCQVPDSPGEVRDKAVAGLSENYARLRTVQVTIETVHLDPSVKQRTETTTPTAGGGSITVIQEPRTVRRYTLVLSGADLRRDPVDPE